MSRSALDQPYSGGFVDGEHHFALTVYYEDTDAAGIVYYANYLKFMERARSDMLRALGIDQRSELERSGSAYAVAEVRIRYRKPAQLGEDLLVLSNVSAIGAASVTIQQRVMRGDEDVADAAITVAFIGGDRRPQRQPREWVERFNAISKQRT